MKRPNASSTLLVKARFDDLGYDIQLTDLSRIWGEKLDREEIVQRAIDRGCSIEASENDQYQVLLDKIQSALNGKRETAFNLSRRSDGRSLEASVTARLPAPLPIFTWTIELIRLADAFIGAEIIKPLLHQASELQQQVQQLVSVIRAKDRVILKITDRLETSGDELATVFPGVSNIKISRKKPQRLQLAQHVNGLAEFEENQWRARFPQQYRDTELSLEAIDALFMDIHPLPLNELEIGSSEWWQTLAEDQSDASRESVVEKTKDSSNHVTARNQSPDNGSDSRSEEDGTGGDGFQKQETPPHLRTEQDLKPRSDSVSDISMLHNKNAEDSHQTAKGDDSTDEDDDLDQPANRNASNEEQFFTSTRPETHLEPQTAGTVDGELSNLSQETVEPELPKEYPKPKPKLGTLGGKKQPEQTATPLGSGSQPSVQPSTDIGSKPGRLGGKMRRKSIDEGSGYENAASKRSISAGEPGKVVGPSTPIMRESEHPHQGVDGGKELSVEEDPQERANQRREHLKRELEDRSKVATKKKRKF